MSNINFEDDQTKMLGKTENIQSLADQVERLEKMNRGIEKTEESLKEQEKTERPCIHGSYSNSYE